MDGLTDRWLMVEWFGRYIQWIGDCMEGYENGQLGEWMNGWTEEYIAAWMIDG